MVADFGLAEKIPDVRWVALRGAGVTEGTEVKGKLQLHPWRPGLGHSSLAP